MTKHIEIPDRLVDKLKEDRNWFIDVEKVSQNVVDYFFRTPYFFPEYTDHGIMHIQKVLEICDKLIPDKSMKFLSSKEIGITIISIIIHDIGMFIQKDGLRELIYGSLRRTKMEFLDSYSWEEEWQNYVQHVKRYSNKKLLEIFGDSEAIKIPDESMENVNEKDILLYGDFLRIMHGRLAHTIAKEGFLGCETLDIFRNTKIDDRMRDIIGLIARSHCIPLRDCKEYLESIFPNAATPKNVSIFYIMALLRISDYLDVGYDRASHVISSMQYMRSLTSKEEYSWNSIIDYDDYEWDFSKNRLLIYAEPRNGDEFLKIETWLNNVQKEIDMSWAVIGEYYGNNKEIGLTIRRVDSNILRRENRKAFEEKFVTHRAVLDTNPDILGLLILPLYDNDPRYGIREMLQNAIDACMERKILEQKAGKDYEPEINICIDTHVNTVTISDNGIGMDEDIIINYFLVSGASFRNSEQWNKYFIIENTPLISRTGRFGIGVLAIFLIGRLATIRTCKVNYDCAKNDNNRIRGYEFDIKVSNENISIKRVIADIGTQIVIRTSPDIIEKITSSNQYPNWYDWYCFNEPRIHYYIDGDEILHQEEYVHAEHANFEKWFNLNVEGFKSYKWSYEYQKIGQINSYCNGIPMPKECILDGKKYGFDIADPVISLVDPQNNAKINLSRSQLCEFPCEQEFIVEGYKYTLAKLLSMPDICDSISFWKLYESGFSLCKNFGFTKKTSEIIPGAYLVCKDGYTLMSPAFLYNTKADIIHVIFVKRDYIKYSQNVDVNEPIYVCGVGNRKRRTFFMDIFNGIFDEEYVKEIPLKFEVEKNFFDGEIKVLFEKFGIMDRLELKGSNDAYYNFITEQYNSEQYGVSKREILSVEDKNYVLAELTYKIMYKDHYSNVMIEMLDKYLHEGWIPFKLKDRKTRYGSAFMELDKYM